MVSQEVHCNESESAQEGFAVTKHVWIVNHHAIVPSKERGAGRHLNLARHLPDHGWTASLLVASTVHVDGSQAMPGPRMSQITEELGVPVLWVRSYAYGSSLTRRLIGMLTFAANLLLPGRTTGLQSPDVVIGSTVHLLAAWAAWRLARRHRVPFIFEIRDVWPDTLIHFGRLNPSGILARSMEKLSVALARRANLVISPLPHVDLYLSDHGITTAKFLWISNGFEGHREAVIPQPTGNESFTFMYLGAHGDANALEGLLLAFDLAIQRRPEARLRLRLVGAGAKKSKLEKFANELESAEYISFENQIPQSHVVDVARESDCLIANMHNNPVYRYGVSMNKLYTYLYSCRPVILGCSAASNPISDSGAGIVVPGDDIKGLAEVMILLSEAPALERHNRSLKGYDYVITEYTYEALATKLARALHKLTPPNEPNTGLRLR
jgi:glycosyltransferase involved in cell wall biosynthesis